MIIGIIGMMVTIGLIVWQVLESKKSGLLRIAREEYEDHTVRYEGRVTYLRGPFGEYKAEEQIYLSVIDGVICLVSKARDFHVIEGSMIQDVSTMENGGNDQSLSVRFYQEQGGVQELVVRGHQASMNMIKRSIEQYAMGSQNQAIS
jgi:hypothetical protein